MTITDAIILGIVQGLTEFLPVSSTAHLRIAGAILGLDDSKGAEFTAIIQLGTLVAVIFYFWNDIKRLLGAWLKGIVTGKPFGTIDSRQGWFIIVATLPIIAIGLAAKRLISSEVAADGSIIEAPLRTLTAVSIQLVAGSILMLVADLYYAARVRRGVNGKSMEQIGAKETIGVGLFQCLALMPGMSRSGTTISGGLLLGLTRDTAARFSFLLSLPAITAAAVKAFYEEWKKTGSINEPSLFSSSESITNLIVSTLVSGIVGYFAIAFLVGYLKRHSSLIFVVYRLIAAALLFAAVWYGWLK